jgi:vacuolar-type H+-ATPase subunit H
MIQERSMLQKIRVKELALSATIDQARREAEEILQNAKNEAEEILKHAEEEGGKEANQLYKQEMDNAKQEVERLRQLSEKEATNARKEGEARVAAAVDYIVRTVAPE